MNLLTVPWISRSVGSEEKCFDEIPLQCSWTKDCWLSSDSMGTAGKILQTSKGDKFELGIWNLVGRWVIPVAVWSVGKSYCYRKWVAFSWSTVTEFKKLPNHYLMWQCQELTLCMWSFVWETALREAIQAALRLLDTFSYCFCKLRNKTVFNSDVSVNAHFLNCVWISMTACGSNAHKGLSGPLLRN